MKKKLLALPISAILLTGAFSCKKALEIAAPSDKISTAAVFADSTAVSAALAGIYSAMNGSNSTPENQLTRFLAAQADEINCFAADEAYDFYTNAVTETTSGASAIWITFYNFIYQANNLIEHLPAADHISFSAKAHFLGEARFIRAFSYFYLVNLFGQVPLVITTDYRTSSILPRTTSDKIYDQIIIDLDYAATALSEEYITSDRVRPNKWTAAAMLARVYLYRGTYTKAEAIADQIINSGLYTPLPPPADVFKKNSKETIWQFYPVDPNYNTFDGNYFIPSDPAIAPAYPLSRWLLAAFEREDARRATWIGLQALPGATYYYPFKYKLISGTTLDQATEFTIVFRLAEQYLVRAEARAQLGNLTGACTDLNVIRCRAGLANSLATDQQTLLSAIWQEKQRELFAEWGHRWFDLKRTGRLEQVLSPIKAPGWNSADTLWPIPLNQKLANPNL